MEYHHINWMNYNEILTGLEVQNEIAISLAHRVEESNAYLEGMHATFVGVHAILAGDNATLIGNHATVVEDHKILVEDHTMLVVRLDGRSNVVAQFMNFLSWERRNKLH